MPASSRKSGDGAPAADAADSAAAGTVPEAPVAVETPAPAEAAVPGPRPAETLPFLGQAEMFVAGVGLCTPGESYPMPAAVADQVCRGERPLFARPTSS
jgi:hypothetical protein